MIVPNLTNNVDYEKCAQNIGSRFDMVLVAVVRARELSRGYAKHISSPNGNIVTALQEIEAGHVGREYLKRVK